MYLLSNPLVVEKSLAFKLFILIIPINFILDFLFYFSEGGQSTISLVRIIVDFLIVLYIVFSQKGYDNKQFYLLYLILIYWFILIFFSSDILQSFIEYLKIFVSFIIFPISFVLVKNKDRLLKFNNYNLFCLGLYCLFVILSNIYGIGDSSYEHGETEGYKAALGDAKLYTPAFLVGMMPFLMRGNYQKYKKLWVFIALIVSVLLILTLRRTAIMIIILTIISYYTFSKQISKLLKVGLLGLMAVVLSYPLYSDILEQRFEVRNNVFNEEYSVLEEGRLMELAFIIETFNSSDYPLFTYVLGREAFNTIDNYNYVEGRPIHVDYSYIFFSSGLLGLVLYIVFIILIYNKLKLYKRAPYCDRRIGSMFQSLLFMFILVGFSGNMWAVTYRVFIISNLGAFAGFIYHEHINRKMQFKKMSLNKIQNTESNI